MKKIIIVFIIAFSIISNLSAQNREIINGTILEKKNINNHTLVSKKHEQDLTLEYERGGPRFCTPEIDIEMELGAGI